MDDIEQETKDKGLVAPRVTPADIEAAIVAEHYFTAGDGAYGDLLRWTKGVDDPRRAVAALPGYSVLVLLTFCVLVLKNGFTVTGESACASPENFNEEIGKKIARQNAVAKLWPLLGYELKTKLAGGA